MRRRTRPMSLRPSSAARPMRSSVCTSTHVLDRVDDRRRAARGVLEQVARARPQQLVASSSRRRPRARGRPRAPRPGGRSARRARRRARPRGAASATSAPSPPRARRRRCRSPRSACARRRAATATSSPRRSAPLASCPRVAAVVGPRRRSRGADHPLHREARGLLVGVVVGDLDLLEQLEQHGPLDTSPSSRSARRRCRR